MDDRLIINIKHRTQAQWLTWLMLIITFLLGVCVQMFHFPSVMKYSLDLLWVILVLYMVKSHKVFPWKEIGFLFGWLTAFLVITLINYSYNYQSVLYYLWGFRNNFRFYILFIACVFFMRESDVENVFKIFDKMFWLNTILCIVQYYGMGKSQDYLGGLFGIEQGCNGALNLFLVVIVVKSIVFYLNQKEKIVWCLTKCGIVLVISAFAELKFFYIEFVLIVSIAILITKFSFRKLLIVIAAILGLVASVTLLINQFPFFAEFFNIESMLGSATDVSGYTGGGDMNRFTGIAIVNERFLGEFREKMFGMGLGNCDYASFEFLKTPFFSQYEGLHYTWLSTAWIYLENGIVGLVMFFGFFVAVATSMLRKLKFKSGDKSTFQVIFIVSICCILVGVYNSSLRSDAAYLIYFVLSMGFWKKEISNE